MTPLVLALMLSVFIGLLLGLLGGGGSVLTVPILLYVLKVPPKEALAMSLLVVSATSAAGVLSHARGGRVRFRTGLLFGMAGMVGAYGGGRLAHFLPPRLLLLGFACMMVGTAVAMLRGRRQDGAGGELSLPKALFCGLLVGSVTGLLGLGGGFMVVPALVLFGGLPMNEAVGTSLLVLSMQTLAGFLGYLGHVTVDLSLAAMVVGAAWTGILISGLLAGRVPQPVLRRAFGVFLLLMATFLIWKQLLAR